MPTKPVPKITSWSFSRWSTWAQCPAKAKYKFIDRLKEPGSSAMDRGTNIGEMADNYIKGDLKTLPKELKLFKVEFAALRKAKALVQMDAAFTNKWDPCEPTDWDNAWVRMKLDTLVPPQRKETVIHVIDNKTGRVKEDDYTPQLELYGIGGFLKFPQATVARTNLWFLDHGVIIGADATPPYKPTGIYPRADLPKLITKWEQRVKPMLNATAFPPRPGDYCRYCHFRKSNNGPCKF